MSRNYRNFAIQEKRGFAFSIAVGFCFESQVNVSKVNFDGTDAISLCLQEMLNTISIESINRSLYLGIFINIRTTS